MIVYFFKVTIVTPISPSPKVPNLKDFTWGLVFKNLWIPSRNFPVPLPWIIWTVSSFAKPQSSKNLSIAKVASSTLRPITLISEETFLDLKTNLYLILEVLECL